MTTWLTLAVVGQFLSAISVVIDRHIVVRAEHIGRPIVYAFYVSILSGFVIVIAPFGIVEWPSLWVLALSLVAGVTFVAAIFFLYSTLRIARASDVAPVVGAVSALTTILLAAFSIDGDITIELMLPAAFLIVGTALISHYHFTRRALLFALAAGFFFGATVLLTKLIFIETSFIDGFFWTRAMNVVVALALLLLPAARAAIYHGGRRSSRGAKLLVIGNKILAGSASVITALAVSLGSVSVVNALAGLQFVFLFVFAFLFAHRMPVLGTGATHGHGGVSTAFGVASVALGLAILYGLTVSA